MQIHVCKYENYQIPKLQILQVHFCIFTTNCACSICTSSDLHVLQNCKIITYKFVGFASTKLQMKNFNLQLTMFPSLQVNKTHASLAQNYKLQVYKFASNKINKNKNHKSYITKLQIYTLQYYNLFLNFLKFKILEIYNMTILQIAKVKICKCTFLVLKIFKCENLHTNNFIMTICAC